jgi:hypothetical protein
MYMNNKLKNISLIITVLIITSCTAQKKSTQANAIVNNEQPIAFPTAEGFGKYTTGGRFGKVLLVTNLNDNGMGSFRDAVSKNEARIIVFTVSGTIHLQTKLNIKANVTIAGQTAPGDGICIADNTVTVSGDNVIIRYLRFRLGDKFQRGGMLNGNGADDAFGATKCKNIIIDHCSFSWSTDEAISVYAGDSTTLQWNLISEPLNYSYHFEAGDKDYENHGFGGIWGGKHLSAHHNLFAHCNNRTPRFDGIRNSKTELVDYTNNVIYNWGTNNIYAGEGGNYNIVNNFFKAGFNTSKNSLYNLVSPGKREPDIAFGKWYVNGNYMEGAKDISKNNWQGINMGNKGTEEDKRNTIVDKKFTVLEINTQSATDAYNTVLENTGASFKRDTLDARIITDVKNGTGKFIDVQGGFPHGTAYEQTTNAWPTLKQEAAKLDTDKDGLPDDWEKANSLNANDNTDASKLSLHKFYTNIELYINTIVK